MLAIDCNKQIKNRGQQLSLRESDAGNESMWDGSVHLVNKNVPMGLTRTKSLFSVASSCSGSSISSFSESSGIANIEIQSDLHFGRALRECTKGHSGAPIFDSVVRSKMEPYIRLARIEREKCRNSANTKLDASLASSTDLPYPELRRETPFLFDVHSYPLNESLREALTVDDLTKSHLVNEDDLLLPLLDRERRRAFHATYDNFVTSLCIPLVHSIAIRRNLFHTASPSRITYRYQAFPKIQVIRPGANAIEPTCGISAGHSIGCLFFHVPLTPSYGTNALFVESFPGREDWHSLAVKSFGLGYLFDGARCLQFSMENTTDQTRVSLEFSVTFYSENAGPRRDDGLCSPELLMDKLHLAGPGFYDEAVIDLGRAIRTGEDIVMKKNGHTLFDPDSRVGAPFA